MLSSGRHNPEETEEDDAWSAKDGDEDARVGVDDGGNQTINGNEGGKRNGVPFDPARANRNALVFLSLLLVMAIPVVVSLSFREPLILIWRASVLVCGCCVIWAYLLSITSTAYTMFLRIIFVFVVALYADVALDPKIRVLVAHLDSHVAIGMLGYALAEHRQHNGTEVSASIVSIPSDKKQAGRLFRVQMLGGAYFGMITAGVAAGVLWVVCHADGYTTEQLLMYVFLPFSAVIDLWIVYVGSMLLCGALIAETGFSALTMYFILVTLFYAWSVMTIGDIWAMILTSPFVFGHSGIFGYCICVYTKFKLRKISKMPQKTL